MDQKRSYLLPGLVGAALAVLAVLANEQVDHYTSTDAFCGTRCHSMETNVSTDPVYRESTHRTTKSGVRAGCADCHIPSGIVAATWVHVSTGVRDVISEFSNDFSKTEVWEARRSELTYRVREWLLATDSATCRGCHEEEAIRPERRRGQRQHADALEKRMTCIACHYNLVHAEVEPREDFLRRSEG